MTSMSTKTEEFVSRRSHSLKSDSYWLTAEEVEAACHAHGDSFYVFNRSVFQNNFLAMQAEFTRRYPRTCIAYSYKTNYTPALCRTVDALGGYAEVVSEMEFDLAVRLNVEGPRIIYNGPCKSLRSIRRAMECGALVNIDSMLDYKHVLTVAGQSPGLHANVGIRCNFPMQDRHPSRFGIDSHSSEFLHMVDGIRSRRNLTLKGLHCHFPDRDLESFRQRTIGLIAIVQRTFPQGPDFIDIGGGFYGELPQSLRDLCHPAPPTYADYAEVVGTLFADAFAPLDEQPVLFIEPGTGLVANSFRFYTRILDIKTIGSRRVATAAGSIQNISPHARSRNLPVQVISRQHAPASSTLETDIAGYTCMEGDYLTKELHERVEVGDFLEYSNVGSYSIVMKPPFILPNVPILMLQHGSTPPRVIRRREDPLELFRSFLGPDDLALQ